MRRIGLVAVAVLGLAAASDEGLAQNGVPAGSVQATPDQSGTAMNPVTGNPAGDGGTANGPVSTEGTGSPLQPNDLGYSAGEPNNRPRIPAP